MLQTQTWQREAPHPHFSLVYTYICLSLAAKLQFLSDALLEIIIIWNTAPLDFIE